MADYSVFARKYRPQSFDDVIGQDHVTTTLKNSITGNRISQAWLFAGPRGVGKTSMARILAKALNCEKGPTITPCAKCESCALIHEGNDQDVIEIDAASNRMVEDARQLRDSIRYAPLRSRFKIYIIDETHMLTRESFNTLLKTLEEPPPKTKFIFATTEPHKLPDTIISRCQRFDFNRLSANLIAKSLDKIALTENIKLSQGASQLIARSCKGSMRDAESMLDQLASYKDGEIAENDVLVLTGQTSLESAKKLFSAVKNSSAKEVIENIDTIFQNGCEPVSLTDQFIELLRAMLVTSAASSYKEILREFTADELEFCNSYVQGMSTESLLYMIQLLFEARRRIKDGLGPEIVFQVAFVKMSNVSNLLSLSDVLEQLKENPGTRQLAQQQVRKPITPTVADVDIRGKWADFGQQMKSKINIMAGALFKESKILKIEGDTITLSVPAMVAVGYEEAKLKRDLRIAESIALEFFGRKISINTVLEQLPKETSGKVGEQDPMVKKVMDKFSGSRIIGKGK